MSTTGIYEQLITQLVEQNLDRESFYVVYLSSVNESQSVNGKQMAIALWRG
ncbi:hypothetical protein H4J58_03875 [Colwellia sp. MB3u-70]|uniref:hypothetical protein n=1 Tax=unclassified Colwellia TaxID=196834 RepID=UPI0015F64C8D|nr:MULTISPECIES: hypothetical protein [unclassified Colwellia]MBA6293772.1 hypothetical protein [Colwellia sp. MB3u-8]MBA6306256.1 hypothetical protein [Colwellia sp. MB3u-70]